MATTISATKRSLVESGLSGRLANRRNLSFTRTALISNIIDANTIREVSPSINRDFFIYSQNNYRLQSGVAARPLNALIGVRNSAGIFAFGDHIMKNSNCITNTPRTITGKSTEKKNNLKNPSEIEPPIIIATDSPRTTNKSSKPKVSKRLSRSDLAEIELYEKLTKKCRKVHFGALDALEWAIGLRDKNIQNWEYSLHAVRFSRVCLIEYLENLEQRLLARPLPVHARACLANEVVKVTDILLIINHVVELGKCDEIIDTALMYPLFNPAYEFIYRYYVDLQRKRRRIAFRSGWMDYADGENIYVVPDALWPQVTPSLYISREG